MNVDSHIDNVTYSFQCSLPRKRKIHINWAILKRLFRKTREYELPDGRKISVYKHFDSKTNISYKIEGNIVTISLAKAIYACHLNKVTHYSLLVKALVHLHEVGILISKSKRYQARAYYLLRSRGVCRIEHALDFKNMEKKETNIDTAGKRYERKQLTRYEIILKGKIDDFRRALKSHMPVSVLLDRLVYSHVTNFIGKCTKAELTLFSGRNIGRNRQYNRKKLTDWLVSLLPTIDLQSITCKDTIRKLMNLERQNII